MAVEFLTPDDLQEILQKIQELDSRISSLSSRVDELAAADPQPDPGPPQPPANDQYPFSPWPDSFDYGLDFFPSRHPDLTSRNIGPTPVPAGTVSNDWTEGQASAEGYTIVDPSTLEVALATLTEGSYLALRAGDYPSLTVQTNNVQLRGLPGARIVADKASPSRNALTISADHVTVRDLSISGGWYCVDVQGSNVLLDNCEIVGWGEGRSKEGVQVGPGDFQNVTVNRCDISQVHDGVSLQGLLNLYCLRSVIHDFYDDGVEFDKSQGFAYIRDCIMYAGGLSNVSFQGSGEGPYYVENSVLSGTRKVYMRTDGAVVPGTPFKVRATGKNLIHNNLIIGQNPSGYANVFFAPGGEFTGNIVVYDVENGWIENSSSEPIDHLIDRNCYVIRGSAIYNYAGMQTLDDLRASGFESNGLRWPWPETA